MNIKCRKYRLIGRLGYKEPKRWPLAVIRMGRVGPKIWSSVIIRMGRIGPKIGFLLRV